MVDAHLTVDALPLLCSRVHSHRFANLHSALTEAEHEALMTHSLRNALIVRWLRTTEVGGVAR
ncbi:hypothetical protein GCM10008957_24500 [Deinococcus ruber]|uniref:Uncharacterized protein n=1 Tax=Deinococcus ruber TaxID=1848197 RepID=A0A918F6W6_9DEIO|nr:hypothetical protein GCM10008957_24500 [Deinococcus ruber]